MQPIEISSLRVVWCFRRVQVLGIAIRIERASTKRNRFSLHIKYREDEPPAKTIVGPAFIFLDHQTALLELFLARALLTQMSRQSFPTVRSKPKPEGLCGFITDAAFFQILAHRCRSFARQLILPPLQRPLVQLDDLIAVAPARFETIIFNHLRQRHSGFLSHDLDRLWKGDPLHLHDEVKDGPTFVTAEAEEHLLRWIDVERGLGFFMKRAGRAPIRPGFLQRHIILHDADDVRLTFEIFDKLLRETHRSYARLLTIQFTL